MARRMCQRAMMGFPCAVRLFEVRLDLHADTKKAQREEKLLVLKEFRSVVAFVVQRCEAVLSVKDEPDSVG